MLEVQRKCGLREGVEGEVRIVKRWRRMLAILAENVLNGAVSDTSGVRWGFSLVSLFLTLVFEFELSTNLEMEGQGSIQRESSRVIHRVKWEEHVRPSRLSHLHTVEANNSIRCPPLLPHMPYLTDPSSMMRFAVQARPLIQSRIPWPLLSHGTFSMPLRLSHARSLLRRKSSTGDSDGAPREEH